jgi:hypothetical protein
VDVTESRDGALTFLLSVSNGTLFTNPKISQISTYFDLSSNINKNQIRLVVPGQNLITALRGIVQAN